MGQRRRARVCVAVLVLGLWASCGEGQDYRVVKLKGRGTAFAMAADTGNMVAINELEKTLALYPASFLGGTSQRVVGPIHREAAPLAVVYKRVADECYFVTLSEDGALHVLGAASLRQVHHVTVRGASPPLFASPNPDDPFVFFASESTPGLYCLRLPDGKPQSVDFVVNGRNVRPGPWQFTFSADARRLYGLRRDGHHAAGWCVRQSQDLSEAPRFPEFRSRSIKSQACGRVPNAYGLRTFLDRAICDASLEKRYGELDFSARLVFGDLPVVVGLHMAANRPFQPSGIAALHHELVLAAASVNSGRTFGTLRLPRKVGQRFDLPAGSRSGTRVRIEQWTWMADPAHRRVVLARGDEALMVPLNALKIKKEPVLLAHMEPHPVALVGRTNEFPVRPLDPACTVRLVEGPEGMSVRGGMVRWKPQAGRPGPVTVTVEVAKGGASARHTFEPELVYPHVALPFYAAHMSVSRAGDYAVVWSVVRAPSRSSAGGQQYQTHLAVVDIARQRVAASRTVEGRVGAATVNRNGVYVAIDPVDRIQWLRLSDLTEKDHLATPSQPRRLVSLAGDRLWVDLAKGHCLVLETRQGLRPAQAALTLKPPEGTTRHTRHRSGGGTGTWIHDQFYVGNGLYEPTGARARFLVRLKPDAFPGSRNRDRGPANWGRTAGTALANIMGATVGTLNQPVARPLVLEGPPVVVACHEEARSATDDRHGPKLYALYLGAFELGSARRIGRTFLQESRRSFARTDGIPRIEALGRRVFVLAGERLFVHVLTDETLAKAAPPLHIPWPGKPRLYVDPAKKTVLPHSVEGGEAPIRFSLAGNPPPGVSVAAKTGTVTIDPAACRKHCLGQMREHATLRLRDARDTLPEPDALFESVTQYMRDRVAKALGEQPAGTPFVVPIRLRATDRRGEVAALSYDLVLLVPDADAKAAVTALLPFAGGPSVPELAPGEAISGKQAQQLLNRLRRLEKENAELKAQVNILKEMLQKRVPERDE